LTGSGSNTGNQLTLKSQMMDLTLTNGNSTEQPPLPSRSSQSPSYMLSLELQQAMALQWLEQQQRLQHQEQQHRQSLNQAILVAAAAKQQQDQQPQPQNAILPCSGNTLSPLIAQSSITDIRHQYLIEMELRRQILLQQQRLMQTTHVDNPPSETSKPLLQERLSQLLSTNGTTDQDRSSVIPTSASDIDTGINAPGTISDVDRIIAAETLLRRNRLQDAIRILQIQRGPHRDHSLSRVVANNNHNMNNPCATSALLLSNDPIMPHHIGQAALTNSSISQQVQPGNLPWGQLTPKVPRMISSAPMDDPYQRTTANSFKCKSDSTQNSTGSQERLTKKLKSKETRVEKLSSFPLPSVKQARRLTMTFTSFQDVWDELETIPLQKEIFIRRLYKYDCKLVD
jgi:hypothetical protein